jgi:hypothetical protein
MSAIRPALAVVGAIGLVIGLLGAAGFVSLGTTCGNACSSNCEVVGYFQVSSSGFVATLTDKSTVVENGVSVPSAISSVALLWGDGMGASMKPGSTTSHTYGSQGTFSVQETATSTASCLPAGGTQGRYAVALTISVSNGTTAPTYKLSPSFSVAISGPSVTIQDTSQIVNVSSPKIVVAWGDGHSTTLSAVGSSATHSYARGNASGSYNQTYSISETATGTSPSGSPVSVTVASPVTVVFAACTSSCPSPPPPPSPPTISPSTAGFNALTGLLILGFGGLMVLALVPGSIAIRAAVSLLLFLLGIGLGWAIGGPGLL